MRFHATTQTMLSLAAASCFGAATLAQPELPPPGGYTVDDVVDQFKQLAHHPDPISISIGVGQDATLCKHYQGVVRHYGLDGTPYLIVSRSGHRAACTFCGFDCSDDPAEIVFARMGSRPKHGERLRSNILHPSASFKDTPPPATDIVETSMVFDGTGNRTGWMHAGGMQLVDDVLVVPMERAWPAGSDTGSLVFIDVIDPANPRVINEFFFSYKVGVFAMAKDPVTATYLLAVSGGDTQTIEWYETSATDLFNPGLQLILRDVWNVNDPGVSQSVQDNWEKWQTLNFIRQSDRRLFLATTDNTSAFDDDDGKHLAGLFEVTSSGNQFNLIYREERKLKLDDPRTGNAAASGGYYVSPTGQLILYTTEHENDGPSNAIRAGELRSYDVSTINGRDPSGDTWIEFYNDNEGWDSSSPDKSFMLDKADFGHENWFNLDAEDGWGDEPDSLRFRAPLGHMILLYKDQNLGGGVLPLIGNGQVQFIEKLDDYGFGDSIHSVFAGAVEVVPGFPVYNSVINISLIAQTRGYAGRLELVTYPGAWIDPLANQLGWGDPGSGNEVLIRARSNSETLILGN